MSDSPDNSTKESPRWKPGLITWILLGLLVWGGYLAIGSYANGKTMPWQRGLIVFGTSVAFVGFWLMMLLMRKWRLARERDTEE